MSDDKPAEPGAPAGATSAGRPAAKSFGGSPAVQIPEELALEIRRLAHDLSNSLEVIVQTSYLLSMAELKEPASDWLRMLDGGVQKALELNLQLRAFIKQNSVQ
jgi:hypothetical protein